MTKTKGRAPTRRGSAASGQFADVRENGVAEEERQRLIAAAAYHRAECRGFAPGHELDDWLEAEAEIGQGARP